MYDTNNLRRIRIINYIFMIIAITLLPIRIIFQNNPYFSTSWQFFIYSFFSTSLFPFQPNYYYDLLIIYAIIPILIISLILIMEKMKKVSSSLIFNFIMVIYIIIIELSEGFIYLHIYNASYNRINFITIDYNFIIGLFLIIISCTMFLFSHVIFSHQISNKLKFKSTLISIECGLLSYSMFFLLFPHFISLFSSTILVISILNIFIFYQQIKSLQKKGELNEENRFIRIEGQRFLYLILVLITIISGFLIFLSFTSTGIFFFSSVPYNIVFTWNVIFTLILIYELLISIYLMVELWGVNTKINEIKMYNR